MVDSLTSTLAHFVRLSSPIEVRSDTEATELYARDEGFVGPKTSFVVAFPRNTAEVSKLVRIANDLNVAIVPRGAGSGLNGAAVPTTESVVISLERMNRIVFLDENEFFLITEPGVITGDIRNAAEQKGLYYPPIPASVDFCTIGGNVATNAGGLCAVKYGVTREYVLGLEVVLASGEVIYTGRPVAKNSTAYNLTQLFVGSEGTLGIITKIWLRLKVFPPHRSTILVPFGSAGETANAVGRILSEHLTPSTLELMPKKAVQRVLRRNSDLSYPFADAEACLLIELDSFDASDVERNLQQLDSILSPHATASPVLATTSEKRNELWTVRKLIRDSLANEGPYEEADSVVPRMKVPELLAAADEVSNHFSMDVISYGHAGDGNLHTYFLKDADSETRWRIRAKEAMRLFFEKTIALGGTLSGEHGIGFLKKEYLPLALSSVEIALMKSLKQTLDPKNLLNPGKIFPDHA